MASRKGRRAGAFCYHVPMLRLALAAAATLLLAGCPNGSVKRPYADPKLEDLLVRIAAVRDGVTSFKAATVMDYWVDDERVKGDVWIMGKTGSRVRINVLSPAGGTVMNDLACNGADYAFVDNNKNCQLSGPCSRETIGNLFGVALAPDDFVTLAVGATPIVAGATGTVTWDGKGHEVLSLTGSDGRSQTIVLDAREGRADVISSEVKTADGKQEWRIDNTGFSTVNDVGGTPRRVPDKSRFRSPGEKADLLVEWGQRELGLELDEGKFVVPLTPGVPSCAGTAQSGTAGTTGPT